MKIARNIDVIIPVKFIVQALDDAWEYDCVAEMMNEAHVHDSDVIKAAKDAIAGSCALIRFTYNTDVSCYAPCGEVRLSNVVASTLSLMLTGVHLPEYEALPEYAKVYCTPEECKIDAMLCRDAKLFEMPRKALSRMKTLRQETAWSPVVLHCYMSFKQVRDLIVRV